jgi:hypothetical protein
MARYGRHKRLPQGFERPALIALSHYPELRDTWISFRLGPGKLPYSSRPRLLRSCLFPFQKRRYLIRISTQSTQVRKPTLLGNLSFEGQIGALGHELAHTSYYQTKRFGGLLLDGLRYLRFRHKERFEKMTDEIALQHGLGPYLLQWCREVYPVKLKDGNRWKLYHAPEALERLMERQR